MTNGSSSSAPKWGHLRSPKKLLVYIKRKLARKHDSKKTIGSQACVPVVAIAPKDLGNKLQLIETLDHSERNLGAPNEANRNVMDNKDSVKGCPQLDEINGAQGKQQLAIATYGESFRSGSSTDPSCVPLMDGKSRATERNDKCVDFIASLPPELLSDIMACLPKESKVACLHVSNTWRSSLLNCESAWAVMTVEDTIFDNYFVSMLPFIAAHVKDLTMDSSSSKIWSGYTQHLQNGFFTKIKSLHLKGDGVRDILPTIYPRVKSTLTELDLLDVHMPVGFTITDILHIFRNLTRLRCGRDKFPRDVWGASAAYDSYQHPLRDLHISCRTLPEDVEPVLHYCQQLQRLVLDDTSDSVLDVVYKTCQNLRILALNGVIGYPPYFDVSALEDLDVADERPGLRELRICSNYNGKPSLLGSFPIIRRNMDTIRIIVTDIPLIKAQDVEAASYSCSSDHSYDDLRFPELQRLSYWSTPTAILEPILLRSISACTALRALTAVEMKFIGKVIGALMTIPPLEELDISHTLEEESISQRLIQLFQHYAAHSRTHTICLSNCESVTDEVLDALADVKSLRTLALWNLSGVSEDGLDRALKKLSGVVTSLNLSELSIVKDRHLATVGAMQGLKKLKLQRIDYISNTGFLTVIETSETLEHLIVAQCSIYVRESAYDAARKKVTKFELNDVIDYY